MTTTAFGASIKRKEDPRLITGQGKYVEDISLIGMLYMVLVRSPFAHAKIKSINTSKAEALDGVRAVVTYKDYPSDNSDNTEGNHGMIDLPMKQLRDHSRASDKVLYAGHRHCR